MRPNKNIVESGMHAVCVSACDKVEVHRVASEWNSSRPWSEKVALTFSGSLLVPDCMTNEWTEYWNTCKKLREL